MKIQLFSQYYRLAQEGKVNFLSCTNESHKEDIELFNVNFILSHKEVNDKVVLYCIACGYEQIAGLQLYENILNKIKEVENEQT
jgi:hypothetical protein